MKRGAKVHCLRAMVALVFHGVVFHFSDAFVFNGHNGENLVRTKHRKRLTMRWLLDSPWNLIGGKQSGPGYALRIICTRICLLCQVARVSAAEIFKISVLSRRRRRYPSVHDRTAKLVSIIRGNLSERVVCFLVSHFSFCWRVCPFCASACSILQSFFLFGYRNCEFYFS